MVNQEILKEIAIKNGTPTYVFDLDELKQRIRTIQKILGEDIEICYAMKANPFLVDAMKEVVTKYEVCSPGEFAICERENIPMDRIVLSGVNKELKDIDHVMDDCEEVGIYTVESLSQFNLLNESATKRRRFIQVLIRVTSGNQFGIDEEEIEKLIANRAQYSFINIRGIQYYSGTQKKKFSQIEKEIDLLDNFCDKLKEMYNFNAEELEYGPGLPISYFEPEIDNHNFEMLEQLSEKLNQIRNKYKITLEIGRYIAATCGIYLSCIADMKTNHEQNYCILDGGINHLNYYGQTMAMKIPKIDFIHINQEKINKDSDCEYNDIEDNQSLWTICGSLCTVADVIVKNLPLHNPRIGDLCIFYQVGAYSVTEGIYLFLSRKLPKIFTYDSENGLKLIRESISSDIINSRIDKISLDV